MPAKANQLPKRRESPTVSSPRRRLPLLAVGVALLLLVAGLLLIRRPTAPAVNAPRLAVDRTLIDFGKVPLDVPVRATFRLSNVGDRPLRILNQPVVEVRQGCCPPRPVIGAMTIQPGQSTQLSMEFMMHKGMGGPHDFRVKIMTDDPVTPEVELVVLSDWGK